MNLDPENRRSFVKKSLATSMTLTFAGLIRAHGDGGTGGTTIDPENTYVTTNSGTTTTFDLEGTYYTTIGNTTTFDLEATFGTTYEHTTTYDQEGTLETTQDTSTTTTEGGGDDDGPWKARTGDPESLNNHHQWSEFTYDGVDYKIKIECIYQGLDSNVKWNDHTYFTTYEAILSARPDPNTNYAKCTASAGNPRALSTKRRVDLRCNPINGAITLQGSHLSVENAKHARYTHGNKEFKLEVIGITGGTTTGLGGRTVYTRDKVLTKLSVWTHNAQGGGAWEEIPDPESKVSTWEIRIPGDLRPPLLQEDDEETPDYDETNSADGDGTEGGWWIVSKSEKIAP